eukprot:10672932-Alexandrium_andersonii.AAC.1
MHVPSLVVHDSAATTLQDRNLDRVGTLVLLCMLWFTQSTHEGGANTGTAGRRADPGPAIAPIATFGEGQGLGHEDSRCAV